MVSCGYFSGWAWASSLDVAVDHADEVVNLLGSNSGAHVSSFLVWVAPGGATLSVSHSVPDN